VSGFTPVAPSAVPYVVEQPRVPDTAEAAALARSYGAAAPTRLRRLFGSGVGNETFRPRGGQTHVR
jgi:hypothetical protein